MDILQTYVVEITFVICLLLGWIIKSSIPQIDNKHIPLILGILGVVINVWVSGEFTPVVLAGGLASAWASTGAYELVKNYGLIDKLFKNKEAI